MTANPDTSALKRSAKLIDATVFDAFKTLTNESETERLGGSLQLLHHLERQQHDTEKHAKERDYTLTRLVRGLGSSTLASRAGYFTTLVAFLGRPAAASITHADLIAVLEKQLNVGKALADKEDSDALVGHCLLVGALWRSGRLQSAAATTDTELLECAQILVRAAAAGKHFHASLAYKFLADMLAELPAERFHTVLWPAVRRELARPWEKHTANTLHLLMLALEKYPETVDAAYLQKSLKQPELLTPLAHKHLGRVFWGNTSMAAITHPAYDVLGRFLLAQKRKALLVFWQQEVCELLAAPNKIKEVVTLKLLTDFLGAVEQPLDAKTVLRLLQPRVIRMMVASLRSLKQQKHDVLQTFYAEFFDALVQWFGAPALAADEAGRVEVLLRFVLHPGTLLIEKYLPQKSVHQLVQKLGAAGVQRLFAVYREVFLAQRAKEPLAEADGRPVAQWQSGERVHAAQMMQTLLAQKCVQADVAWRTEQLKFLLRVGLFHVDAAGAEVVRKEQASTPALSRELALAARQLFYASLQMRLPQLRDEQQLLHAIVEHANELVGRKHAARTLLVEWTAETAAAWQQMYEAGQKAAGKAETKTLQLVFQILFEHMGLQLFREPEMARLAIADLVQCAERTRQVKKAAKKQRKQQLVAGSGEVGGGGEEPEWIEVVVDLFLHLLSQNTSFMRNVVNNVFPQLCGSMTLTAVHQILAMLDMKDGKSPLEAAAKEGDEEEEEDDDDEADEKDSDEEMPSEAEEDDDDEEEDDDDEDDDEDDDMAVDDDEGTVSDQLRNAVSTALGSLLPSATNGNDDDNDSVDLNDMDDAEAERLDSALSAAFKSIRGAGASNPNSKSKKKTKAERTTNTTVMHFRTRVLDLIDIYLKTAPALSVCVETLLALFNMIEHCTAAPDQKPLADRVDRVLRRLLALRQFSGSDDVTGAQLAELLEALVARKVNPVRLAAHTQLLAKTVAWLLAAAQQLPGGKGDVELEALIGEYAAEFVGSRNPRVAFALLQDVFRVRWLGVWRIARAVAERALGTEAPVRTFRRTQALELLALVYRNHGFIAAETKAFGAPAAAVEAALQAYVTRFAGRADARVSAKEFGALVELLAEVQRAQKQVRGLRSALRWERVAAEVQAVRRSVVLVEQRAYRRFCAAVGVEVLKNEPAAVAALKAANQANGKAAAAADESDEDETPAKTTKTAKKSNGEVQQPTTQAATKRKSEQAVGSKREQKMIKLERMRLASAGLGEFVPKSTEEVDVNEASASEEEAEDDDDDEEVEEDDDDEEDEEADSDDDEEEDDEDDDDEEADDSD